ncbi:MAG TPA: ABC transporter substrate-binding protein, partial [Ktedonobacteraceae bacterium]
MRLSTQRPVSFLASLMLISLFISGCSSNLFSTAATHFSSDPMTLNIGQISTSVGFFPLYVAEQENFFAAQGLKLDPPAPVLTGGSGAKMSTEIEQGDIEVAGGGLITDAFTLARIDDTVRILGALTTGYYVDITVSKKFEQETGLTEKSSLADKVDALLHKKIGITAPNSGTAALVTYLFRIFGHDAQRDVQMVSVGSTTPTTALAALQKGTVDAISYFSPAGQLAEAQGIGNIFISPDGGDVPEMNGQVHGVFYTRQGVIDAKPMAIQAFIRAIAQAEAFIHDNPTQTMTLLGKYIKQKNPKITKAVYDTTMPIMPQTPLISQQGYNTAATFHVKAGLLAIAPAYDKMIAT